MTSELSYAMPVRLQETPVEDNPTQKVHHACDSQVVDPDVRPGRISYENGVVEINRVVVEVSVKEGLEDREPTQLLV